MIMLIFMYYCILHNIKLFQHKSQFKFRQIINAKFLKLFLFFDAFILFRGRPLN